MGSFLNFGLKGNSSYVIKYLLAPDHPAALWPAALWHLSGEARWALQREHRLLGWALVSW